MDKYISFISRSESNIEEGTFEKNKLIKFVIPEKKTRKRMNTASTYENEDKAIKEESTKQESFSIRVNVEYANILESMFESEFYETGISNPSEKYFLKWFYDDPMAAMNGLTKIFWDNYLLEGRRVNVLLGVLHILSHMRYSQVYPVGPVIAGYATSHMNNEVAEYGLKCYENWESADVISKLEAMSFSTVWLQEYADEIIAELKGEELHGITG